MGAITRVLDLEPVTSLDAYVAGDGGRGLDAARRLGPVGIVEHVDASGLRGRGGAGFPTGAKWRTVLEMAASAAHTTVVVNAAEGEPGSFKDRAILRANPYRVIEGALIAALAVAADEVVVALKASFTTELARVRRAFAEIEAAGWPTGMSSTAIALRIVEGPGEYLYGEETALLEVVAGREPFPRIAPPYRHGVDELGDDTASAAGSDLASAGDITDAPPTLVNNTETMANVPGILAEGPDWFRSVGTAESPGTVVCTVSGTTQRHGVGEFAMGTPLSEVIDTIGGGVSAGRQVAAVLSGVANPFLPGKLLDTAVSYEAMRDAGTGLGAAGFLVFDDHVDLLAVAQGVSRFLSVESCGQCQPCKQDGQAITRLLDEMRTAEADRFDMHAVEDRLVTVTRGARCFLAQQHQSVVESLLLLFPGQISERDDADEVAGPALIAPIVDIVDDRAALDERHLTKQPDWTFDDEDSGQSPADRLDVRRDQPD
ncbi:hypothetical protein BH20ACT2_BH20ACT2_00470 [soil metagenome]